MTIITFFIPDCGCILVFCCYLFCILILSSIHPINLDFFPSYFQKNKNKSLNIFNKSCLPMRPLINLSQKKQQFLTRQFKKKMNISVKFRICFFLLCDWDWEEIRLEDIQLHALRMNQCNNIKN